MNKDKDVHLPSSRFFFFLFCCGNWNWNWNSKEEWPISLPNLVDSIPIDSLYLLYWMSFKNLLKSFARSPNEIPKNLYEEGSSLPEGKDMGERLSMLYRLRKKSVPARRPIPAKKGIAICLVIVNELRHESIWKDWIASSNDASSVEGELFIHAKQPEGLPSWVRSKLVDKNFLPEWNSTEVIRAMLATMEYALSHCEAERLIFATESCIPIYNLATMTSILYSEDQSWLNARNEAESAWERGNCFESVDTRIIPREAVWKALPGWIMLTRRHAMDIIGLLRHTGGYDLNRTHDGVSSIDLVRAFGPPGQWNENSGGVFAPEEVFFATMLSLLGYLKTGFETQAEVKPLSISYATWARRGDANPQIIHHLDSIQLHKMRRTGALMARKFDRSDFLRHQWQLLIASECQCGLSTFSSTGKRKRDNEEDIAEAKKTKFDISSEKAVNVGEEPGEVNPTHTPDIAVVEK